MHLRVKHKSGLQDAIDRVADPARRREIAENVVDVATRLASDVASKSADIGAQVGDKASDLAQTVSDEGRTLMEQRAEAKATAKEEAKKAKGKKRRHHRVRNAVALTGVGAVAGYFLDPENGRARREAARRRTSTSSRVVGNGLDRAAQVAHQTAEATAVAPEPARDPLLSEDIHLS